MADALLQHFRSTLPPEVASSVEPHLAKLIQGDYEWLLNSPEARTLLDDQGAAQAASTWSDYIFDRLGKLLSDRSQPARQYVFFTIGYGALLAFVQSNVTGPPLPFSPADLLLGKAVASSKHQLRSVRKSLLANLSLDGIAAYSLTPNIELLCLADAVFTAPAIIKNVNAARWAKLRAGFLHQRLLSEPSSTLQNIIYDDLSLVAEVASTWNADAEAEFLLERASIHIHHGLDKFAHEDLEIARKRRGLEYALTGLLGKRTKFQVKDISQLVVLAKSADTATANTTETTVKPAKAPEALDLNDDTLLEAISFTQKPADVDVAHVVEDESSLPPALASLDPSAQPQLHPIDSALLLLISSSITNTSPQDGLTREETLPYATRALEGGSANWQVYTQALLVRSRVEGYRSRTTERGLLQLQALVDQVIADTTGVDTASSATSFLPRPKEDEAAPASERLRYVFALASPSRWDLEGELASRWVSLGGLRTALDIYERLEMWAEAALCWAATEREDKARRVVRQQLFHATAGAEHDADANDEETWQGRARDPQPLDAPRLYCILGDIDQAADMYEQAWIVSKERYARAQRSLGRLYIAKHDYVQAAQAYSKSLRANQLHHGSWFALGCSLLELAQFDKAVEAFTRCVQLDESDGEAWSNLAAALLRKEPEVDDKTPTAIAEDDDDDTVPKRSTTSARDAVLQNRQDALKALKRAATLKHDSHRIWENVLVVAASVSPPDYASILTAQRRLVDLRGPTIGDRAIDYEVLELLVQHIMAMSDTYDPSTPGLQRMTVKFIDETVIPLITSSVQLWRLVSKLALWRNRPSSALDAEEKAWRAVTSQPGWESEDEVRWNDVVEATVRLCDSYESLGQRERTEGMGAGELVAKDWKFKARTAVRGILGRGKATWEGTDGWERLQEALDQLRG